MGAVLALLAVAVVWGRELELGRLTLALGACGAVLLALAAGLPEWNRPSEKWIAVMVDVSASTRGAAYRDRANLEKRVAALLGNVPHRMVYFADGVALPAPTGEFLADVPSEKTFFPVPPGAAAMLVFSDCRFELPRQIAPAYVVVDPALDEVIDARVKSLEIRGSEVGVTISNGGNARGVSWRGTAGGSSGIAPGGSIVLTGKVAPGAPSVGAELTAGDAWPENDALSATVPPPQTLERWWVGHGSAPTGWRAMVAGDMPSDSGVYLVAGVIVLDNISAGEISETQQQRLSQYVRHAGGGLVILGGERAYGAGGYAGTPLEEISPLASRPPEPTVHWVVLVDQSGSMGSPVEGGGSRWDYAARAVKAVVSALPGEDLASVGGFSEDVNWWVQGKRVKDLAATLLPPGKTFPHGPTNLEPALDAVTRIAGAMPVQLLVISDFDANIGDPLNLAKAIKSKNARVHVLAIGQGQALKVMQDLAAATGGASTTQLDPTRWTATARELLRATLPDLVRRDSVEVKYGGALDSVPAESISVWNRTWAKAGSKTLAEAIETLHAIPMAADWNFGEGRVVAAAFEPGKQASEAMAALVERKPHDPRFRVTWEAGKNVHVEVDGVDEGRFLNDLHVEMEVVDDRAIDASSEVTRLAQTAPGKYEADFPAPRSPRLATVRAGGQVIERYALADRYALEFEAIGNDHAAMEELARRSGGRVIGMGENDPVKMEWPGERVPMSSEFGIAGAGFVLSALWRWRRS